MELPPSAPTTEGRSTFKLLSILCIQKLFTEFTQMKVINAQVICSKHEKELLDVPVQVSFFFFFFSVSAEILNNTSKVVASLTVSVGKEFHFPHSFLKFQYIFLIFLQTFLIFFLILASPIRKVLATPLNTRLSIFRFHWYIYLNSKRRI